MSDQTSRDAGADAPVDSPAPTPGRLLPPLRDMVALAVVALLVAGASLLVHNTVLEGVEHSWDSIANLFQARVFASGRVAAPRVPVEECFKVPTIVQTAAGRFAIYPPGWPAMLAPAVALGMPALAGAVLLAAGIALLWSLAFRLWGRREAWIATALLCASPFYFFMGQSYLSHLPCAVFLMLALLALHGAALAPTTRRLALWAAGAGAAAGMAFLIRPFSAMLGMAGMGVILVGAFERDWRRIARIVGFAAIGSAWALAALALHNALTTGSPLRMGYSEFSKDFGFLGYGRFRRESVWENFGTNLPFFFTYLNTDLWGGMIPDLCLPALALVVAWRDRMARALAAAALLFVLCHSFYFYFDLFYGPRLAFETLPWLVLLTARGIGALWDRLGALRRAAPARLVAGFVLALWLPSAVALSWPRLLDYYSLNYGGQGRQVRDAVAAKGLHNALVVVRSTSDLAFCTLYNMNPIDIANGDVVFARTPDRRETLSLLREAFPKHEKWVLDVEYEPLAGRNWYPERFRITKLEWARPAAAATPAPSMNQ